jgi:hypothetical protein
MDQQAIAVRIGDFARRDDERFHAGNRGRLDLDGHFFAQSSGAF